MRVPKKYIYFLIPFIYFAFNDYESKAQLAYKPISTTIAPHYNILTESSSTRPRPGFKKRRYGRHTFFAEAGYFYGYYTGLRYSFNYDILAQSSESNALTLRIGYGRNNAINDTTQYQWIKAEKFIPLGINILLGRINQFELGLGGYYFTTRKTVTPYASLGFRHQNPKGGFMYRVAFDMHLERVYDKLGRNIQKTGVYGPLVGLGWTF